MQMLQIAGGTYLENCSEPEPSRSDFYGSGGRAAACLAQLASEITLNTYISLGQIENLEALAATFGFKISTLETPATCSFTYLHGLSTPTIEPAIGAITPSPSRHIEAENILRFGMLEGDAVVSGERVVYDPQSPRNPRPFGENGSIAKHLAFVANAHEAKLLTRETTVERMSRVLMTEHGAEVAVIKRGPFGASVTTSDGLALVPAHKTNRVWPSGSGDVFSAVFAYCWATLRNDPVEAAQRASLAASYYCSGQPLPIPADFETITSRHPIVGNESAVANCVVYLAGPFFTLAQRWLVNETRTILDRFGVKVFSPLHDVGHGSASEVAPADIEALNRSSAVIALIDGLDSGTLFEIGYARAKDIPVVAFVQNECDSDLKMLEGTHCTITNDFVSAIYNTIWAAIAT